MINIINIYYYYFVGHS